MATDIELREAEIFRLFDSFPTAVNLTRDNTKAYAAATAEWSIEALSRSVTQFTTGRVDRANSGFAPSSAELCQNVAMWELALAERERQLAGPEKLVAYRIGAAPPPPMVPLGPIEVDFGQGAINMRDMSHAQKEAVLSGGAAPEQIAAGQVPRKLRSM